MKIGIFGGTFNPVHLGHTEMVNAFLKALSPDRILLIPNRIPPHKAADALAAPADRSAMLRLALGTAPACEIDEEELNRPGKSYMVDTVAEIARRYPDATLYLLIGGDSLLHFSEWRCYRTLLRRVTLVALARKDEQHADSFDALTALAARYQQEDGARILLLPAEIPGMSSSQIRQAVADGTDCASFLPPAVWAYIQEHRLYGYDPVTFAQTERYGISAVKAKRLARETLSEKRFFHVSCVAKETERLARLYGGDAQAAEIAGWLHDLYREADRETLLQKAAGCGIVTDDVKELATPLLHGRLGSRLLRAEYGVCPEICLAVRSHTEGDADMSLLQQQLFVADATSADRAYPDTDIVRALANQSLNKATAYLFSYQEKHLGARITPPCRAGAAFYRPYLEKAAD